jgi:hypothetical protein
MMIYIESVHCKVNTHLVNTYTEARTISALLQLYYSSAKHCVVPTAKGYIISYAIICCCLGSCAVYIMMINQQHNSPALRRADMGIAMAITGSEVSREAASLVLLDDRFASVVEGIKRGRIIFASMKKV